MHSYPYIHVFLNIEGVVWPRGHASALLEAEDLESLHSMWTRAKSLEGMLDAIDSLSRSPSALVYSAHQRAQGQTGD